MIVDAEGPRLGSPAAAAVEFRTSPVVHPVSAHMVSPIAAAGSSLLNNLTDPIGFANRVDREAARRLSSALGLRQEGGRTRFGLAREHGR